MNEEWTDQQIREAAEEDDLVEKFMRWSDGVGSGWKLSIYREEPKEYAGFLEEVVIDQSENPADLNAIVQKWGGRCLRLMLRGPDGIFKKRLLVPLRTYPPLMHGRPIVGTSNPFEHWSDDKKPPVDREDRILEAARLLKELSPSAPPPSPYPNMLEGISLMMPLLKSLLEAQMSRAAIPTPQSSIQETLSAMAAMKEFMGDSQPVGDSELGSMLPSVLKLGEALLLNKKEKQETKPENPILIPPVKISEKTPNPTKQVENQRETVQNILEKLPSTLAKMPGEQGASFFLDILRRMPEKEQESCLRVLFEHFGVEEEDENRSEKTTDKGRASSSNEGDPTPNRPVN